MPHIRMRALTIEQVAKLSEILTPDLSSITKSPADNFTFELVETTFFTMGKKTSSFPFIEVLWFPRPQEVKDACAKLITQRVKEIAAPEDIVILFQELSKDSYYENGEHF